MAGTGATRVTAQAPHRRALVALLGGTAVAAAGGAAQLVAGVATPPDEDLPPGLTTWVVPGGWLLGSVAVPCGLAAWLAWRGSPRAPVAAVVAAGALAVELLVQVPYVGTNPLQAVMGGVAVGVTALALDARRHGWRAGHRPARPHR